MNKRHHQQRISKSYQQDHISVKIKPSNAQVVAAVSDYSLGELSSLKDRLNEAKSKLDVYYLTSKQDQGLNRTWMQFQNTIDIYKPMRAEITRRFNGKHVTNAWMKYWEIYSRYNIIPARTDDHEYTAFFNAELPGAALCAFNHYMKAMRPGVPFDWRASSLAPSGENKNSTEALGDYYGIYANNRDKWLMTIGDDTGHGNTGDSTIVENILDFAAKVGPESEIGGVDLYSHDAGIDVSTDSSGGLGFNNQELANAKVHLGCALAGLLTLRPGGTFIAKQYTMFESFTWNLILIYAELFDEFYICKPLTSRAYNSEIYLVGKGYKGIPEPTKEVLIERLRNFNTTPLIDGDQLGHFGSQLTTLQRFARIVFGQQTASLGENVELFERYKTRIYALKNGLDDLKRERARDWFAKYPMKAIADADQLPSNGK
jgi:hypothetical protein